MWYKRSTHIKNKPQQLNRWEALWSSLELPKLIVSINSFSKAASGWGKAFWYHRWEKCIYQDHHMYVVHNQKVLHFSRATSNIWIRFHLLEQTYFLFWDPCSALFDVRLTEEMYLWEVLTVLIFCWYSSRRRLLMSCCSWFTDFKDCKIKIWEIISSAIPTFNLVMQSFHPSRTRISAIIPMSMMESFQKSQNKPKKKAAKLLGYKVAKECHKIELYIIKVFKKSEDHWIRPVALNCG